MIRRREKPDRQKSADDSVALSPGMREAALQAGTHALGINPYLPQVEDGISAVIDC